MCDLPVNLVASPKSDFSGPTFLSVPDCLVRWIYCISSTGIIFCLFFFGLLSYLELHPRHVEVPELGVESEL